MVLDLELDLLQEVLRSSNIFEALSVLGRQARSEGVQ